jgi:hypothetical protein
LSLLTIKISKGPVVHIELIDSQDIILCGIMEELVPHVLVARTVSAAKPQGTYRKVQDCIAFI